MDNLTGYAKKLYSSSVIKIYRFVFIRKILLKFIRKLENGDVFSVTIRRLFFEYHNVKIGKYSYGGCFVPGVFPSGSIIGNYCSFGSGLKVFRRNHPVDFISQHPFFYNKLFGFVERDMINENSENPLIIGSDVWVGSGVTFLPGCRRVGNGAIIGSDSVVTKDVPDFAIVGGNPARLIRLRFDGETIDRINRSNWWDIDLDLLLTLSRDFYFKKFDREKFEKIKFN